VTHTVAALSRAPARVVRDQIRAGRWASPTTGLALGHVQANLVILPEALAGDFEAYCRRNPQAMPVLDITAPGDPHPRRAAPDADIRSDVPRYRVYRHGVLTDEPAAIHHLWAGDSVAFLLGCSFSAEAALLQAGITLRHLTLGKNVPMFRTNRQCAPAGVFHGPLVVSMRPIQEDDVAEVIRITGQYPLAHGTPIQVGKPGALGINVAHPDWGDVILPTEDETPVFWACGVTPQAAIMAAAPPLAITHAPGHMFITDLQTADIQEMQPPN
jgi:uncharacterized protein YcsI (UPF0317 family)